MTPGVGGSEGAPTGSGVLREAGARGGGVAVAAAADDDENHMVLPEEIAKELEELSKVRLVNVFVSSKTPLA